jgi:hypothetical protein
MRRVLLGLLLGLCCGLSSGLSSAANPASPAKVTVTLVRWPYT